MPRDYSDHTILLACLKEHDLKAFDYLYTNTRNRLFVLAFAIIKDEAAARDLVQDFFIDFWQNRIYLNIHDSLKYYLTRSIRNRALKYLDKQKTQLKLIRQQPISDEVFSINLLENKELRNELETAIQKLPPVAAKVFRLHYMEKLSHADIAVQLGISKSTVSSHIARALKDLRTEIKKK